MLVAATQLAPGPDPDVNVCRAAGLVEMAALEGAELVLLPELFAVPPEAPVALVERALQMADGWLTAGMLRLAQRAACLIAFGYPELCNDGAVRSSLGVVGPAGHQMTFQKVNLFGWDNLWGTGSDLSPGIVASPLARLGALIGRDCYN